MNTAHNLEAVLPEGVQGGFLSWKGAWEAPWSRR